MSKSSIGFTPNTSSNVKAAQKVGSLDPRLSRTDYFDGRLLTATDLIRDQVYVDERVLEVGRALGSGVVRGLALELSQDKQFLRVDPGMAITESGRVLEISGNKPVEINLNNTALLIRLNNNRFRRFNRGLYAVTLQFREIGSDPAESYPADPVKKNEFQFDSFIEGAEVTLTPLNYPLPSDNELVSRASLARHFLSNPGQPAEISGQGISLGLLAMNNNRAQWLDTHMLRRPLRPEHVPAAWQMDLNRHYLELLDQVLLTRSSQSQSGEFSASQYFHLLPPTGVLPMASVDPIKAAQYFFPENYEVSISPIRYEDLAVIQTESLQLAPLDLDRKEGAEIMILAPMSNQEFFDNARSMGVIPEEVQTDKNRANFWLQATDLLQQRLSVNSIRPNDNAKSIWNNIWNIIGKNNGLLHYVRRPARAAETQVSAVVLAHGFTIPAPSENEFTLVEKARDEALAQLGVANQEASKLQAELVALSQSLEALNNTLELRNRSIDELEQTSEACAINVSNLMSANQSLQIENDNLRRQNEKLKKQLQDGAGSGDGPVIIPPDPGPILDPFPGPGPIIDPYPGPNPGPIINPKPFDTVKDPAQGGVSNPAKAVPLQEVLLVDKNDTQTLNKALDALGTTEDVSIRNDATKAINQIKKQAENVQVKDINSTENIIKNTGAELEPVIWKTVNQASKNGSLQKVEKIVVNNANDPLAIANELVKNSETLGINKTTSKQINRLSKKIN